MTRHLSITYLNLNKAFRNRNYLARIRQILEEDKSAPKKQRHTAKRIFERIRSTGSRAAEHGLHQETLRPLA